MYKIKNKLETIGDFFHRSIYCFFDYYYSGKYFKDCGNKTQSIESVKPFALKCFKTFSGLSENLIN
jgi:hypothetical protein